MTETAWGAIYLLSGLGIALLTIFIVNFFIENRTHKEIEELREKVDAQKKDLDEIAPPKFISGEPKPNLIVGYYQRPNLSKSIDLLYDYLKVETKTTPEKVELVKRKKQFKRKGW